jgi:serine/threonine protein kinase
MSELANHLKLAKSGTPLYFALVPKGAADGALFVEKHKIEPRVIDKAKKDLGTPVAVQGRCFGEGDKIIFETVKEPQPNWEKAVKMIALRDASYPMTPEFRLKKEEAGQDANKPGADPAQPAPVVAKQAPAGAPSPNTPADCLKLLETMDKYIESHKEADHAVTAQLKKARDEAKKLIANQDFGRALSFLTAAAKAAANAPGSGFAPVHPADRLQWTERLHAVGPFIKTMVERLKADANEDPQVKAKGEVLEQVLDQANKLAEKQDFAQALMLLNSSAKNAERIYETKKRSSLQAALKALDPAASQKIKPLLENATSDGQLEYVKEMIQEAVEFGQWQKQFALESVAGDSVPRLKDCKVGDHLGSGGSGDVYRLESTGGPPSVLKVKKQNIQVDFKGEAAMYARIGAHPNIVRCLGYCKVGDSEGLVMEALTGGDAEDGMNTLTKKFKKGEISHEELWGVRQYTLQKTLQTLAFIHSQGVVHADIKPENLMFDAETGDLKVVDFGLAQNARAGSDSKVWDTDIPSSTKANEWSTTAVGTKAFASQEQFKDWGMNALGDLFSVGASAFWMGEGDSSKHNSGAQEKDDLTGKQKINLEKIALKRKERDCPQCQKKIPFYALEHPTDKKGCGWTIPAHVPGQCPVCAAALPPQPARAAGAKVLGPQDPDCKGCGWNRKEAGEYAHESEYVKFVNQLMDPDVTKRPTLAQALDLPFMKDRMIDDDRVKELIKGIKAPAKTKDGPPAVAIPAAPAFTAAEFQKSMENIAKQGVVSGSVTMVAEALERIQQLRAGGNVPALNEAKLDVVNGVNAMFTKLDRKQYPGLHDYLKNLAAHAVKDRSVVNPTS